MKKKIIIGFQCDFHLYDLIKENLIFNEFDLIDVSIQYKNFKYKNIFERINNFFRKTFLQDKLFKTELKYKRHEKELLNTLNNMQQKADYALLIRPDIYPEHFIKLIKTKTQRLIAYQWDGLKKFPLVCNLIPLFDQFFVFDAEDYTKNRHLYPNIRYATNFYFDIPRLLIPKESYKNETLYIGGFVRNRMADIFSFINILERYSTSLNINIVVNAKHQIQKTNLPITYRLKPYTYEENLEIVKNASTIIDFNNKLHRGLSFRPFEAICFEKKLITGNTNIKYYDFYTKENIFIIGEDDELQLEKFLNTPYQKIDERVKQKYSFSNWIKYVLNIEPFAPITMPSNEVSII